MTLQESLARAKAVRTEAARLAQLYAAERDACGDPEGAEVLLDLARAIRLIAVGPRQ